MAARGRASNAGGYQINQKVQVRDQTREAWKDGVVASVEPFQVRLAGLPGVRSWKNVRPCFKLREKVQCRDHGEPWQEGVVTSIDPLQVMVRSGSDLQTEEWAYVRPMPDGTAVSAPFRE